MSTKLEDLVGLRILDAVDFETLSEPAYEGADYFEDANTCRFRLDGVIYVAVENPSDGYRSSMRELRRQRKNTKTRLVNVFPPTQVFGVWMDESPRSYGAADLVTFYATANAKPILTVGTRNTDDYHPSFVAHFRPENLPANTKAESQP